MELQLEKNSEEIIARLRDMRSQIDKLDKKVHEKVDAKVNELDKKVNAKVNHVHEKLVQSISDFEDRVMSQIEHIHQVDTCPIVFGGGVRSQLMLSVRAYVIYIKSSGR